MKCDYSAPTLWDLFIEWMRIVDGFGCLFGMWMWIWSKVICTEIFNFCFIDNFLWFFFLCFRFGLEINGLIQIIFVFSWKIMTALSTITLLSCALLKHVLVLSFRIQKSIENKWYCVLFWWRRKCHPHTRHRYFQIL